jgi:hypothetical protein
MKLVKPLVLAVCLARKHIQKSPNQMNKRLLILLSAMAFAHSVSPIFGAGNPTDATRPAAPAAVNIYDWFKIGEYADAIGTFRFNAAVYDKMDHTYNGISDALTKAHVSDSTLSAFKQLIGDLKALPWDKNYQTWTKKDQETWKRFEGGRRFYTNLIADVGSSIEARFGYWLGHDALELAWDVPYYQENGWADSAKSSITNAAYDFVAFSTNADYKPLFTALKPEIQNAITLIAAAKKKIPGPDDPFARKSDLTPDDVAKIVEAAKTIREAGERGQLTSSD